MFLINQLIDISSKNFIFLTPFDSEFSFIEVWFTNQNSKPLEIKDKIMHYSAQPRDQIFVKSCEFLSFTKNMDRNIKI